MPNDVVVVFVHGINVTCQDYYQSMRDRVLRYMPRPAQGHVIFRAVFWADIVRGRQQEYLHYARSASDFRGSQLHQLVIEGLGDAAAYQKTRAIKNSAYYDIQRRLGKTLRDVVIEKDDRRPLVFVGHSLGCHIISSYAWDLHRLNQLEAIGEKKQDWDRPTQKFIDMLEKASPLERLDTFAGFVTMGSNMPLFTFTFGPQYVHPITRTKYANAAPAFPGKSVSPAVRSQALWLNYFSLNDPLGYPLRPLNDSYDSEPLLHDIPTRSEGWWRQKLHRGPLRSLAAMSAHTGYWSDRRVARGTADLLYDIIYADEIAARSKKARSRYRRPYPAATQAVPNAASMPRQPPPRAATSGPDGTAAAREARPEPRSEAAG